MATTVSSSAAFVYPFRANKLKLPCWSQSLTGVLGCKARQGQRFHRKHVHIRTVGGSSHHYPLTLNNDLPVEPFWLSFIKEFIWGLISVFKFLVEQPGQLKYIEWPGFQSTLKTTTLTLVLVALLIVALSSVDAVFCYLLALLLKRTPQQNYGTFTLVLCNRSTSL